MEFISTLLAQSVPAHIPHHVLTVLVGLLMAISNILTHTFLRCFLGIDNYLGRNLKPASPLTRA